MTVAKQAIRNQKVAIKGPVIVISVVNFDFLSFDAQMSNRTSNVQGVQLGPDVKDSCIAKC